MNIYVGNIPYAATEDDLKKLFQEYGPVATVTIIRDRDDGRSKGFGFVEMENQEDGEQAIEALDGQEMMGRPLKVNEARPREQRNRSSKGDNEHGYFHNPYTFVPTPPRPSDGFAGDFNPLKHPCGEEHNLDHASLKDHLWTGHIPITLKTVTPLVLLKTEGETLPADTPYDVLDYIPESSLRGMLRSAYEVITNSRYGCFSNSDRLAYRMDARKAVELIPAIIKNGEEPGKLDACLCLGTSVATERGPKRGTDQRSAMYAAMLNLYDDNKKLQTTRDKGYIPKTGEEVWAEIVLCEHDESPRGSWDWNSKNQPYRNYLFWKAVKIWPETKNGQVVKKPGQTNTESWHTKRRQTDRDDRQSYYAPHDPKNPQRMVVKGRVLITNENMKGKHDERIFFVQGKNAKNPIKRDVTDLKEAWRMRIQSYRKAHTAKDFFDRRGAENEPWKKIGDDPGETAWSPHLYQDSTHLSVWRDDPRGRATTHDAIELQEGDMVYARCKFDQGNIVGITDLFPVMISRELYKKSPKNLLDASLRPAEELRKLSPADRLFGWTPQGKGSDGGYKSRIRVVCDGAVDEDGKPADDVLEGFSDRGLPLTILGEPKPAQGRFYVGDVDGNKHGIPQEKGIDKTKAGYNKDKTLRGRKQYWHHKGLEADQAPDGYWDPSCRNPVNGRYQEYRRFGDRRDPQNRSIKGWIKPETVFRASLYVQNLGHCFGFYRLTIRLAKKAKNTISGWDTVNP